MITGKRLCANAHSVIKLERVWWQATTREKTRRICWWRACSRPQKDRMHRGDRGHISQGSYGPLMAIHFNKSWGTKICTRYLLMIYIHIYIFSKWCSMLCRSSKMLMISEAHKWFASRIFNHVLKGNSYAASRNWGHTLGIFFSKMNSGIQNRFSLLYYYLLWSTIQNLLMS